MILPVALCSLTGLAVPRVRSVRGGPDFTRILWIGAHPDDEALIAPLLGKQCVDGLSDCSILVMTRGENGGDGTIRTQEMQSAATLLHSRLTQWTLPDVMQFASNPWNRGALVQQIANVIESERPSIVITFDPNHGSSCHPAHRALASIVVDAAAIASPSPPVYFVETFYTVGAGNFIFRNAVTWSAALLTWNASSTWQFLIDDVRAHASQFTSAQVEALAALPYEQKQVWLMPASAAAGAQYNAICP